MHEKMENLTSVCNFFEYFLEFYKIDLGLREAKQKEIIGPAKTR